MQMPQKADMPGWWICPVCEVWDKLFLICYDIIMSDLLVHVRCNDAVSNQACIAVTVMEFEGI